LQRYLDIAVPAPLRRSFHYLPPTDFNTEAGPGCRIRVPFGNKQVNGMLLGYTDEIDTSASKLKRAEKLLDQKPVLPKSIFDLCIWASDYYHHPVGEVFGAAMPVLLRQGRLATREIEQFSLTEAGKDLDIESLKKAPKQQAALSFFKQNPEGANRADIDDISASVIRALIEKALIERKLASPGYFKFEGVEHQGINPSAEQQIAIDSIRKTGTYLLQGITGSGKTEVYLRLIERALEQGRQSLVLVPEIGLTPQTVQRFRARFRVPIAVLHSGLTDTERLHSWQDAASGHAGIVIGTRSAIFTPLAYPGLIVVDEEHDTSFKQHEGFKYSARDLAVLRGNLEQIPVLLGSATPSLESLHNAQRGKYSHLHLRERPIGIATENYSIISLKHQDTHNGFSDRLVKLMRQHLEASGQVLVFLNRRGFAPVLLCPECHWMANCARCDARLIYHLSRERLICHHCGFESRVPKQCTKCQSPSLLMLGLGTQRIEEHLKSLFPDTRVMRIDRDSTRLKGSFDSLLDEIAEGKPAVLVGTQMLAKGHHFSNVTLSVMVEIDSSFYSSDFKAIEHMGQLILQVGGRSGRAEKSGTVVIQTHFPEQPVLKQLISDGYGAFADTLLQERRETSLPPFSHQAIIRAESTSPTLSLTFLDEVAKVKAPPLVDLFGPFPSSMEKRQGRFRAILLLSSRSRQQLQRELDKRIISAEQSRQSKKVRWSVDVDPIDLF
tara:strand:- start:54 stop:2222 length:2169 start_codon:yes stop_codon:yes gene_type:complete